MTFKEVGAKAIVGAVTVTVPVLMIVIDPAFHVDTVPVIVEVPMPLPVTVAVLLVWPARIVTLEGVGTLPVLLDVKLTVAPPVGAACDSVTVKLVDRPRPTEGLLSVMLMTVTVAVALVIPEAVAVIVEVPATKLVTVTFAVV